MVRPLPPLTALRAFEAAARHQSFSHAAAELNVSHTVIGRHVRGLEQRLGVHLMRREARGVRLTADGRAYLARISPAFDEIAQATEALGMKPEGMISVSSEALFALKWLISRVGAFENTHPDVTLCLDDTDRLADIDHYESDLAIRFCSYEVPELAHDLISNAPVQPFAAPAFLPKLTCGLEKLPARHLFQDRDSDIWGAWFQAAGLSYRGPPLQRRMRPALSIAAAASGHGVIITSCELVETEVANGELVPVSDITLTKGGYYLIYREGARRVGAIRAFCDWLLNETVHLRSPVDNIQPYG